MSFCLIILAGGKSHRFKSNIPKPYQKIAGKSLIEININKALKINKIKKILVVYNKKDLKNLKILIMVFLIAMVVFHLVSTKV